MTASPLKVALVGAGYFSQFHLGSWSRLDEVVLVGLCDADASKAEARGAPAFSHLETMLERTRPDLLDIIVPPHAHAACIRAALAAGLRWIICQKPFCGSLSEAREIVAEAQEVGATLVVHENFRFQPWYRAIKTSIDAGDIGEVLGATFRLRPGDGQGPRAYLDRQPYFQEMPRFLVHETAVHWIDTFRFLFGDPTAVYADLRRINPIIAGEDAAHVVFDHPGNCRALFDGNRHLDHAADNPRRTMGEAVFEGTAGTLLLRGDGSVTRRAFATLDERLLLPPDTWDGFGGDCVHALQAHVVNAMLHGTEIENQASAYLTVIEIEEAIYASAADGRKVRLAHA
ncbi:MAG: Gfo/Idh/MocA family oxidoreductase [Pseudomonadota bacterium]